MAERPAAKRRTGARAARRGTLLDSLPRTPAAPGSRSAKKPHHAADDPQDARDARASAADITEATGRLTLPSMPRSAARRAGESSGRYAQPARYDAAPYADDYGEYDDYGQVYDDEYGAAPADTPGDDWRAGWGDEADDAGQDDGWDDGQVYRARSRARSLARPLSPALPQYNDPDDALVPIYPPLPTDSAPELIAYHPMRGPHRVRLDTRALARTARNPWTITRLALTFIAILLALAHAPGQMGEQAQPLMTAHAQAGLAAGGSTTSLVQPETQLKRPDLYDNYAQFQEWGDAACSAAALSEVLTAYGVPHATIGHEIDELGSYISPNGGLLNRHGFVVVAAKHNLRADESTSLTYNQLVYLTQQLGMPVIVNVRISYGYYSFFDGGHFLVVVGGDAQGLAIVDSSEYYIHYLPKDVFYQMFTGYTAAIVPGDYQYTLPND